MAEQCQKVHETGVNLTQLCSFIRSTDECKSDGFIQYTYVYYCGFPEQAQFLGLGVFALLLLVYFAALSTAAELFLCPSLAVISRHLRFSENMAGVTLLAFGNGAPDVFSSLAAVLNSRGSDPGLSIGALLGGGVFLSTVVVGIIVLIRPFQLMQRPMLRDLLFYLLTVYLLFTIMYSGQITFVNAVGFIILYGVYVIVVALGRVIRKKYLMPKAANSLSYQRFDNDTRPTPSESTVPPESRESQTQTRRRTSSFNSEANKQLQTAIEVLSRMHGTSGTLLNSYITEYLWRWNYARHRPPSFQALLECTTGLLNNSGNSFAHVRYECWYRQLWIYLRPCSKETWKSFRWYQRTILVLNAPVVFLLKLTVPLMDEEDETKFWCKPVFALHFIVSPLLIGSTSSSFTTLLRNVFPVWLVILIVGVVTALCIHFTSSSERPPFYYKAAAYLSFVLSIIWIYVVAKELVGMVQTLGTIFGISNEILGLTVLAWCNSLGDLVADISVAKDGYPRMAVSACFGGPLFNMLIGVGVPFMIQTWDAPMQIKFEPLLQVLSLFIMVSLCLSLVVLVFANFNATRPYAVTLLVLYATFLITAMLTEFHILPPIFPWLR